MSGGAAKLGDGSCNGSRKDFWLRKWGCKLQDEWVKNPELSTTLSGETEMGVVPPRWMSLGMRTCDKCPILWQLVIFNLPPAFTTFPNTPPNFSIARFHFHFPAFTPLKTQFGVKARGLKAERFVSLGKVTDWSLCNTNKGNPHTRFKSEKNTLWPSLVTLIVSRRMISLKKEWDRWTMLSEIGTDILISNSACFLLSLI